MTTSDPGLAALLQEIRQVLADLEQPHSADPVCRHCRAEKKLSIKGPVLLTACLARLEPLGAGSPTEFHSKPSVYTPSVPNGRDSGQQLPDGLRRFIRRWQAVHEGHVCNPDAIHCELYGLLSACLARLEGIQDGVGSAPREPETIVERLLKFQGSALVGDLVREAADRIVALQGQLQKYGQHLQNCPRAWVRGSHDPYPNAVCRCGFDASDPIAPEEV